MSVDVDATESGLYVVRWQVISGDTHPGLGQFAFRVGQNGGVVSAIDESASVEEVAPLGLALQAGCRWLHFLGYALSFGVLAFQILILPATSDTVVVNQRVRQLVGLGLLLLLLAEPLALLGQTASLGPGQLVDPAAVSAAFDSSLGRTLSLRLGALFLLWVLLGMASAGSRLTTLALGAALAVKVALAIGAFVVAGWAIRWKGPKPRWWIPELVAECAVMGAAGLVVSLRPPA